MIDDKLERYRCEEENEGELKSVLRQIDINSKGSKGQAANKHLEKSLFVKLKSRHF